MSKHFNIVALTQVNDTIVTLLERYSAEIESNIVLDLRINLTTVDSIGKLARLGIHSHICLNMLRIIHDKKNINGDIREATYKLIKELEQ